MGIGVALSTEKRQAHTFWKTAAWRRDIARTEPMTRGEFTLSTRWFKAEPQLGLVPLVVTPAGEPGALLLHHSGLLEALEALFGTVRRAAHPLEPSGTGGEPEDVVEVGPCGPTELDRRIPALLLSGLTDLTDATRLGLSSHTLHRRLRHLMDMAGVRTRMRSGAHAVRNGWTRPL
ncbi:hypothetical protein EDD98_4908 [Streptomyces sp. PanSC19]|uniref:hypothetical protein n=1 Tax=Streptomyces sp. PanSC19 TaxID=1520455 RepID=UPI000F8FD9DB|nr:hypothetical protein [Streptomyces sp. PanSC19]ROQ35832.1 hypothetical protein EDD98_4908 [Streptomyces sp. PanSC19]